MDSRDEEIIRELRRTEFRDTAWRMAVWLAFFGLLFWLGGLSEAG